MLIIGAAGRMQLPTQEGGGLRLERCGWFKQNRAEWLWGGQRRTAAVCRRLEVTCNLPMDMGVWVFIETLIIPASCKIFMVPAAACKHTLSHCF